MQWSPPVVSSDIITGDKGDIQTTTDIHRDKESCIDTDTLSQYMNTTIAGL